MKQYSVKKTMKQYFLYKKRVVSYDLSSNFGLYQYFLDQICHNDLTY